MSKMIPNKHLYFLLLIFISGSACQQEKQIITKVEAIRINQLGYYPQSIKEFILVDSIGHEFSIVDEQGKAVYTGILEEKGIWNLSGEKVRKGDFSAFNQEGRYAILIDGVLQSYYFDIKKGLYEEALNAAVKSYYFQRASFSIDEQYGGIYQREAGHPDTNCQVHPSTGRSAGVSQSPGGWYDAGDYGKYIGNASLSTGQLLHLLELFPDVLPDGVLNIPESGNGVGDLRDELKYELDWILTMQDADGGVYHKLTAKKFGGFIMPADYRLDRWVIGKGTAASLNFSAVLAQASRLFMEIDPQWSSRALLAAEKAWRWAIENDDVQFKNPDDVVTGEYGDDEFSDDFYWAAAELYLATQDKQYLTYLKSTNQEYKHQLTNSWKFFVRNNGFHSLLENQGLLDDDYSSWLRDGHLKLADEILQKIKNNPYHIALDRFEWGSNSDMLNQAMILCIAHRQTKDDKYLLGAEQINDYIFGKNATGNCFLTAFGSKRVMFPHHRPSGADGIADPIPGFIVGGPNHDRQDVDDVDYPSEFPAKAYMDVEASFASNEVCLNWNAPAVFVMAYLEEQRK